MGPADARQGWIQPCAVPWIPWHSRECVPACPSKPGWDFLVMLRMPLPVWNDGFWLCWRVSRKANPSKMEVGRISWVVFFFAAGD